MTRTDSRRYPTMVYNPNDPEDYRICETQDQIPEGWVDNQSKCLKGTNDENGNSAEQGEGKFSQEHNDGDERGDDQEGSSKPSESRDDKSEEQVSRRKSTPKGKAPTLKSLGLSKREAMQILEEEGVELSQKPSTKEIAALVSKLL